MPPFESGMFRPSYQAPGPLTRSSSAVLVVGLLFVPAAMLVGTTASNDACVIGSEAI